MERQTYTVYTFQFLINSASNKIVVLYVLSYLLESYLKIKNLFSPSVIPNRPTSIVSSGSDFKEPVEHDINGDSSGNLRSLIFSLCKQIFHFEN